MRELENKLKQLQKDHYEYVTIQDVLKWISNIRWEAKAKRIDKGKK